MSQGNRIDHECVSMDSLVRCLKQRCGDKTAIRFRREEDDPPDFWLFIDGNKFAVEETSIATEATIKRVAVARKQGSPFVSLGYEWQGRVQSELTRLIQNTVSTKRKNLEQKRVPKQCENIILLLYDAHGFGDPNDAKKALCNVQGYDWFHSVFWAASFKDTANQLDPKEPGRVGSFLYTKEGRWQG